MKALAFVTHGNNMPTQWQYDKIMSAIAYDLEITIIFINDGLEQIHNNQSWKCLDIYGIKEVYYFSPDCQAIVTPIFQVSKIGEEKLHRLIKQAEVFI